MWGEVRKLLFEFITFVFNLLLKFPVVVPIVKRLNVVNKTFIFILLFYVRISLKKLDKTYLNLVNIFIYTNFNTFLFKKTLDFFARNCKLETHFGYWHE
ncbi:hypothetical protein [Spiroplasma endosymbiont of Virgichneumon dumeticola]|uniref:hypothetical protein n=1 Tax=Spiroplasma endosymbiont of Virgichneumon dumeticola TaxID=3139323 RepID=UPI0035C929FE